MPSILKLLENHPDSELEQAIIRIALGIPILVFAYVENSRSGAVLTQVLLFLITLFVVFSVVLMFLIVKRPHPSPSRRIIGMVFDMSAISYVMFVLGEAGSVIFSVYLWVIVGNGLRYGKPYLYGAMSAAVIGFSIVVLNHEYWTEHRLVSLGIIISFIALPMYFSKLLTRIAKVNHSLEQRVKERTQDLAIAHEQALAANIAKNQFLANMSHELRTPLNAIIGYSEMLEEDSIESRQDHMAQDLRKIKDSGKHLLEMIGDILDLATIEAGKVHLVPEPIPLKPFLEQIKHTVYPLATKNNNELVICYPQDDNDFANTEFIADKLRLRQILLNLLSNACKFTQDGKIELAIAKHERYPGESIEFIITDTGMGIKREHLRSIFEPFKQADNSFTRQFGGKGLGLTISRNLCDLMGGEIHVTSTVGEGSVFSVILPCKPFRTPHSQIVN